MVGAELSQRSTGFWVDAQTQADALGRPASTQEVGQIMRLFGLPVVVQGGQTGLSGGHVAGPGNLIVSTERLNSMAPVDFVFGHVADGNLHVAASDAEISQKRAVQDIVFGLVSALGGAVSAEHGVGRSKCQYPSYSRSDEEIALMRRMKASLDPAGLLNPGVML